MDTSETYVKMCERAKEIQKLWKKRDGDFIFYYDVSEPNGKWIGCDGRSSIADKWLPRQDQLQEMVDCNEPVKLLIRFHPWLLSLNLQQLSSNHRWKTMEQLWLTFVMKEKYGKTWNGEDWVKA